MAVDRELFFAHQKVETLKKKKLSISCVLDAFVRRHGSSESAVFELSVCLQKLSLSSFAVG